MPGLGEPSVEEILDSIKKVIARDNRERESLTAGRRAQTAVPEPSDAEEAEEVLELESFGEDLILSEDELNTSMANEAALDEIDALMRGDAEAALRENFAALATLSQPGKAPQIVRQGETSLEGLVREMLRPMLSRWLDENLPEMVENLVKAEIARIAGKRG
ncbi:DUF2497 domain-containing protein [Erythrobacter litoralis]|uniref:DUF2497 domain-containing protein n=1 Tax=Erythrobacter litoralis TaxID=39960 RepID=UPI002434876B|nr:DUF2497 domain-containing protein [Erythrobacter litoralis]MDG6079439.1 DUF2497 domain-containing protein [Erythrobacter litoralis]